jgi:hypothetical protein
MYELHLGRILLQLHVVLHSNFYWPYSIAYLKYNYNILAVLEDVDAEVYYLAEDEATSAPPPSFLG